MKICIAGWYFEKELFDQLSQLDFDVSVVVWHGRAAEKHKEIKSYVKSSGARVYKNWHGGLEFGNYDFYLKNIWDGESSVLFMHDDVRLYRKEVLKEMEEYLEGNNYYQAFIFRDEAEEISQGRQHGRAIFCNLLFLKFILEYKCECKQANDYEHNHYEGFKPKVILNGTGPHKGIWFDPYNLAEHVSGKPPEYCRHYNDGIYHFANMAGRTAYSHPWPAFPKDKVRARVHFSDFATAHRGEWKGKIFGRGSKLPEAEVTVASADSNSKAVKARSK